MRLIHRITNRFRSEPEQLPDFPDVPPDEDYKAGYALVLAGFRAATRSLRMRAQWVTWIVRVTAGVAFAALIVVASAVVVAVVVNDLVDKVNELDEKVDDLDGTVTDLDGTVTELSDGRAPVSVAAKQRAARTQYLECFLARDDIAMVPPEDRADIEKVCEGYGSLADAYKTAGVPAPD